MTVQQILELIARYGLGPVVLCMAVWYLNRQNEKMDSRREAERTAFREERDKRLAVLEKEVVDCKEDRRQLHANVDSLQAEVRGLMRKMIEDKK